MALSLGYIYWGRLKMGDLSNAFQGIFNSDADRDLIKTVAKEARISPDETAIIVLALVEARMRNNQINESKPGSLSYYMSAARTKHRFDYTIKKDDVVSYFKKTVDGRSIFQFVRDYEGIDALVTKIAFDDQPPPAAAAVSPPGALDYTQILDAANATLHAEIEKLKRENQGLNAKVSSQQTEIATLITLRKKLEESVKSSRAESAATSETVEDLYQRLRVMKSNEVSLNEELEKKDNELAELLREIHNLETLSEKDNQKIDTLKSESRAQLEELNDVDIALNRQRKRNTELEEQILKLQNQQSVPSLADELNQAQLKNDKERLEKQLRESNTNLQNLENLHNVVLIDVRKRAQEIEQLEKTTKAQEQELQKQRERIDFLNQQRELQRSKQSAKPKYIDVKPIDYSQEPIYDKIQPLRRSPIQPGAFESTISNPGQKAQLEKQKAVYEIMQSLVQLKRDIAEALKNNDLKKDFENMKALLLKVSNQLKRAQDELKLAKTEVSDLNEEVYGAYDLLRQREPELRTAREKEELLLETNQKLWQKISQLQGFLNQALSPDELPDSVDEPDQTTYDILTHLYEFDEGNAGVIKAQQDEIEILKRNITSYEDLVQDLERRINSISFVLETLDQSQNAIINEGHDDSEEQDRFRPYSVYDPSVDYATSSDYYEVVDNDEQYVQLYEDDSVDVNEYRRLTESLKKSLAQASQELSSAKCDLYQKKKIIDDLQRELRIITDDRVDNLTTPPIVDDHIPASDEFIKTLLKELKYSNELLETMSDEYLRAENLLEEQKDKNVRAQKEALLNQRFQAILVDLVTHLEEKIESLESQIQDATNESSPGPGRPVLLPPTRTPPEAPSGAPRRSGPEPGGPGGPSFLILPSAEDQALQLVRDVFSPYLERGADPSQLNCHKFFVQLDYNGTRIFRAPEYQPDSNDTKEQVTKLSEYVNTPYASPEGKTIFERFAKLFTPHKGWEFVVYSNSGFSNWVSKVFYPTLKAKTRVASG